MNVPLDYYLVVPLNVIWIFPMNVSLPHHNLKFYLFRENYFLMQISDPTKLKTEILWIRIELEEPIIYRKCWRNFELILNLLKLKFWNKRWVHTSSVCKGFSQAVLKRNYQAIVIFSLQRHLCSILGSIPTQILARRSNY